MTYRPSGPLSGEFTPQGTPLATPPGRVSVTSVGVLRANVKTAVTRDNGSRCSQRREVGFVRVSRRGKVHAT